MLPGKRLSGQGLSMHTGLKTRKAGLSRLIKMPPLSLEGFLIAFPSAKK
jgi:hypothetical protein